MPRPPYIVRFFQKVEMDSTTGCWNWTATKNRDNGSRFLGYGRFRYYDHRQWLAHRAAYDLMVGPIPDGMTIDHLCGNPACVNPEHLEVVTQRENWARGNSSAARTVRTNVCKHGHALTTETSYFPPGGGRECLICRRANGRRRYWEQKALEASP